MGTLQINILGTSFAIQAEESNDYLETLLAYYTQMVDQVKNASGSDSLKTAILAGIMLCDELYKEKIASKQQLPSEDLNELEKITLNLIKKIDKVIDV